MAKNTWIGVDFDGTLSEYHGFKGPFEFGPPIPAMQGRVMDWLEKGKDVRILTARVSASGPDYTVEQVVEAIQDWCEEHVGARLIVTCMKDYEMIELWDDRAVSVEKNTGKAFSFRKHQ